MHITDDPRGGNPENDKSAALEDLRICKDLLRLEQEARRVERDALMKRHHVDAMALSFERKEHERTRAKSKMEIEQALSKAEEGRVLAERAQERIDQAKEAARIRIRQAKEEAEGQTRQITFQLHRAEARARHYEEDARKSRESMEKAKLALADLAGRSKTSDDP